MSVHKRGNSYFVRYRDQSGKQRNKHFGVGKAGKSKAEEFDLQVKLAKKKKQQVVMLSESDVKLQELLDLYLKDYGLRGQSAAQAYNIRRTMESKIIPKLPNKRVDRLTYADLLNMLEHYPKLNQSTKNRYFAYLRAVFNWGIAHDYITVNPLQKWKMSKEAPRQFEISLEELTQIIRHSPPHLQLIIEMTFYLGLRPGKSELFKLKWDDVDFENRRVFVFATKTKQNRYVPIPDILIPILKKAKRKAKTEYVIEYNGKPVLRVDTALKTAKEKAGITKSFRLYDLRHMYATLMMTQGGDLAAVSANLGHSDISLTANTYYQPMEKEKARAANLLPQLDVDGSRERSRKLAEKKKRDREAANPKKKKKKRSKVTKKGYAFFDGD
ncbi:tyrosine-type recombinase/integrase [Maridesulfovibrio sp.]|uniref:tyrosine-type recombinase/integrase n=1 Tax=Maridesulfovibrio sp. TaxID=2795000 RepID=UPI0029CA50C1|nr:tyrosine-type recombinase/integrase [Maridesulfovibrio sp.]